MNEIIIIVEGAVSIIAQMILFQVLSKNAISVKYTKWLGTFGIYVCVNFIVNRFVPEPINLIFLLVTIFILSTILTNKENCKRNYLLFLFADAIDALVKIFIENVIYDVNTYTLVDEIGIGLVRIVLYMIVYFLFIKHRVKSIQIQNNSYLISFLLVGIFIAGILLNVEYYFHDEIKPRLQVTLIASALLLVVLDIFIVVIYLKREKERNTYASKYETNQALIKLQEQYFNELQNSYDQLRSFKHDVNGYISVMKQHLISNDIISLQELLDTTENNINNKNVIVCNNTSIGAIVNHYADKCQDNIDFSFDYHVLSKIKVPPDRMCSLFYNLLENAYEAVIDMEIKKISLFVKQVDNNLFIKISNTIDIQTFNISYINNRTTSKNNKIEHGIGLKNINDIIDLYHGKIEYEIIDNMINVKIYLLDVII